jgi:hypothetical protein
MGFLDEADDRLLGAQLVERFQSWKRFEVQSRN